MQFTLKANSTIQNSDRGTAATSFRERLSSSNAVLWTVQGILAAVFLVAGASKLVMSGDALTEGTRLPEYFLRFIGLAEVLGSCRPYPLPASSARSASSPGSPPLASSSSWSARTAVTAAAGISPSPPGRSPSACSRCSWPYSAASGSHGDRPRPRDCGCPRRTVPTPR